MTIDAQGLLETLAQTVKDGRAEVEETLWEYARGDRLLMGEGRDMARLAAQLVVLDDIYQDLLMLFMPWRLTHDEKALALTIAKQLAKWSQRGHELVKDPKCSCGHEHSQESVEQLAHVTHGETYIAWADKLIALVNAHLAASE